GEPIGIAANQGQLIAPDGTGRLMVWQNYAGKSDGAPADFIIRSDSQMMIGGHARLHVDRRRNWLWTVNAVLQLQVWQLPLTPTSRPIADNVQLRFADTKEAFAYGAWAVT